MIIIIDKNNGKSYDYNIYKSENIIYYDLFRDKNTKKFPILELFFWIRNQTNRCFFAYIEGQNFTCEWPIKPYGSGKACQIEEEFDANIFDRPLIGNTMTLKIFTRPFKN